MLVGNENGVRYVRRKLRFLVTTAIVIAVLAGTGAGLSLWYTSSRTVSTDNARVDAALVPVVVLNAGKVVTLNVNLGSYVESGENVAAVEMTSVLNASGQYGFGGYPARMANIVAPVSGFVAAVWSQPGAVVPAGQPIVTLYDPSSVWITANIKETKVGRVRPGQEVEVKIDSLGGRKLAGKVVGIATATASTFSLLPQQNTTGNFTKVVQVVPVRITLEEMDGAELIPGASVEVTIHTK